MKFINLKMVDAMTDTDEPSEVWVLPDTIVQIESFSGPFGLRAYGPDGKMVTTGKFKDVIGGSLIMLATMNGGGRVCYDSVKDVLEKLESTFD